MQKEQLALLTYDILSKHEKKEILELLKENQKLQINPHSISLLHKTAQSDMPKEQWVKFYLSGDTQFLEAIKLTRNEMRIAKGGLNALELGRTICLRVQNYYDYL